MGNSSHPGISGTSKGPGNGPPNVRRSSGSAQVRRSRRTALGLKHVFYGRQNGIVRIFMPQKFQHHGATPNLTNGIGDAQAGDIRSGAMDWFKQGWKLALGVQILSLIHI